MAKYFAQGRLGWELTHTPAKYLWIMIRHSPAGDSVMQGETFQIIKDRIVKQTGADPNKVSRVADYLRKRKLRTEMKAGGIDPSKYKKVF
jgi:hypothetical protein